MTDDRGDTERRVLATFILFLAAIVAGGAVTGWYAYRLQTHHLPGLPEPEEAPPGLALSAVAVALTFVVLAAFVAVRRRVPKGRPVL